MDGLPAGASLLSRIVATIDTSSSVFTLTYRLTEEEAVDGTTSILRRSRKRRDKLVLGSVIVVAGVAAGLRTRDVGFYFFAASGAAYLWMLLFGTRRAIRRRYAMPGEIGERTIWVLNEGLAVASTYKTTLHRWEGITRTVEGGPILFVVRGKQPVFAVPIEAFAQSGADRVEFERLVRQRGTFRADLAGLEPLPGHGLTS